MGTGGRWAVRLKIGHRSELLPLDQASPDKTHRWTVFVRPITVEDFTDKSFVEKVTFELHPDFPKPLREVKRPPFEVSETGYAGFQIPINIWFVGGRVCKTSYDLSLTMEPRASYNTIVKLEVTDVSPAFISAARKYGAEKIKSSKPKDGRIVDKLKRKEEKETERDRKSSPISNGRNRAVTSPSMPILTRNSVSPVKEEVMQCSPSVSPPPQLSSTHRFPDYNSLKRRLDSLRDPSSLFQVALFLLECDSSSHFSLSRSSLSYDLSQLDDEHISAMERLLP